MPLVLPPAVNYTTPLVSIPALWALRAIPPEGPKLVPVEINWGTDAGADLAVNINMQNNAVLNFSRVVAISVDNSACAADVQFIFQDTSETTVIPAYTPKLIIEVFTNGTQFIIYAPNASDTDVTRFSFHNVMPPPVAVPVTQTQNNATANNINIDKTQGGVSTAIIAAGVNGIIEAFDAQAYLTNDSAKNARYELRDGTAKVVWSTQVVSSGLSDTFQAITDLTGLHVPFRNGLYCHVVSSTLQTGSRGIFNLYYRTP